MESKKEKCHPTMIEKRRRKRSDRDLNPGVGGHIAEGAQNQEADGGREVDGGHTAEEEGLTVEEGVHMIGDRLEGDHLPHIIGLETFFY